MSRSIDRAGARGAESSINKLLTKATAAAAAAAVGVAVDALAARSSYDTRQFQEVRISHKAQLGEATQQADSSSGSGSNRFSVHAVNSAAAVNADVDFVRASFLLRKLLRLICFCLATIDCAVGSVEICALHCAVVPSGELRKRIEERERKKERKIKENIQLILINKSITVAADNKCDSDKVKD